MLNYKVIRFISSKAKADNPNLTITLKEILIGLLLGDGWLKKQKVNARFRLEQGDIHKELFFLVLFYKIFYDFCQSPPRLREKLDKRTNKIYYTWHFSTKSYSMFTEIEIYNLFYKHKIKIIPVNTIDLIGPVSLAMWIMCDGWKHNKGGTLATNAFSKDENQLLIDALNRKFALDYRLIQDHNYSSIHIPYSQMANLKTIVLPYMHKSFLYKMYL